jgi:hypothetical protein
VKLKRKKSGLGEKRRHSQLWLCTGALRTERIVFVYCELERSREEEGESRRQLGELHGG